MSKAKISTSPDSKAKVYDFCETLLTGSLISGITAFLFTLLSHIFMPRIAIFEILQYPASIVGIIGAFVGASIYKKCEAPKRGRSFYTVLYSMLAAATVSAIILLIVWFLIPYAFPVNI